MESSTKISSFVNSKRFGLVITAIIVIQAIVLGLETFSELADFSNVFEFIHWFVVSVFIVEAGLKLASQYPRPQLYFRDGWNVFDFAIIVLSLIPFTGAFRLWQGW